MFALKYVHHLNFYREVRHVYKDDIITEVWKNRDEYVESQEHNLSKMIFDLKKREKQSTGIFVDRRNSEKEQPAIPNN